MKFKGWSNLQVDDWLMMIVAVSFIVLSPMRVLTL